MTKKTNFSVKGSLFLNKVMLKNTPINTVGFFGPDAIAIYHDRLYFNTSMDYSLIVKYPYVIPFQRTSESEDGFTIDLEKTALSYVEQKEKPNRDHGWIGPFDVEIKKFSWDVFYAQLPLYKIIEIWDEALDYPDSSFEKMLRKVKRKVAYKEYKSYSLESFRGKQKNIDEVIDIARKENQQLDKESVDYIANDIIIKEGYIDKRILDKVFQEKTRNISSLTNSDLQFLIEWVDANSSDQDLMLAAQARRQLDAREQKKSLGEKKTKNIKSK
ncbi:MAG: hypothetical protein GXP45_04570 [bacterium]|nr:hypothetical protein [bacterium]